MTNDRTYSHAFAGGTVDRANVFPVRDAGTPALERTGILSAVIGAARDRAAVWQLSRKSDRVLADMGLSRETLAADVAAARKATTPAREPATGLYGVLEAAIGALAGPIRDAATARQLSRKSDRVLADMGLNRETLVEGIAARRTAIAARRGALVSQRLAAWREEQRIYRELSSYTDAELADFGMGRGDVRAAARGHAVMLFRDAGLIDGHFATDGSGVAANGVALRRAA